MSTRRGFLRALAVGSIVAPVGASGLLEPAVKIIEPAKVEPVNHLPEAAALDALGGIERLKGTVQVLFRTDDGNVLSFAASAFVSEARVRYSSRDIISGLPPTALYAEYHWSMEGYLTDQWRPTSY